MNQILVLNNPWKVDVALNKLIKPNIDTYDCDQTFTNELDFGIK